MQTCKIAFTTTKHYTFLVQTSSNCTFLSANAQIFVLSIWHPAGPWWWASPAIKSRGSRLLSMKCAKKIRKHWKTAKIAATRAEAVGGPPCACQGCHSGLEAIKSTGERWSTTNWARVIRKYTKERYFLMKPNQNASASLSVQNPDKHYTFLMQTSQNCVHICKCPLYQNTTLSLSKLRPYLLVSTISKHYTFLITYSSVHHFKNTTHSLWKLRPYFLSHIQVSTISKHYNFLIKIAPIFLITYASVHYIKTLHFPYQNCAHISYHICKCPPYHNTTLFLYKHAKIASIDKCPLYQMASFFLHYCPPYHSQHFFYTQSPQLGLSHVLNNFPNESLPKIAKIELFSSFLMKVCPKSQNLGFPYLLSRSYSKVYPKSQNLRLGRVPIWSICVPT